MSAHHTCKPSSSSRTSVSHRFFRLPSVEPLEELAPEAPAPPPLASCAAMARARAIAAAMLLSPPPELAGAALTAGLLAGAVADGGGASTPAVLRALAIMRANTSPLDDVAGARFTCGGTMGKRGRKCMQAGAQQSTT